MLPRLLSLSLLSFALSGCSSLEFPWVYRISVQQGNIIDQEEVDKLELGMTKRQVQFVMGSPLLIDTFNQNRWDYYYSRRDGDGNVKDKRFTLFFEGDKYIRHEGDIAPSPASEEPDSETENKNRQQADDNITKEGDNTAY
ncbi:outer membrane protein assembly factor BamE [Marinagarivorans cellulosilyticus]|uniref:Outer membrane protein assembly factor BamE n=1 Tax=Marinagarivorans cellulosilyticus TaxID=2721545 RepID=A0AAN1WIW8_9GAMM|nr:outer membrane protein assembly factor BamE [Marinagarivorans cellulosilyticus]BCD98466.1 outer membrane protein assembly factor BamE [Marinagarivorans cellulosilyticus]